MRKTPAKKAKTPRKPSTPEQRQKARARRWSKTGVSAGTVAWMKDSGLL